MRVMLEVTTPHEPLLAFAAGEEKSPFETAASADLTLDTGYGVHLPTHAAPARAFAFESGTAEGGEGGRSGRPRPPRQT
jgi:hypothetical protein